LSGFLRLFSIFILSVALTACGSDDNSAFTELDDDEQALQILKNFETHCESTRSEDCPSHIGSLVSYGYIESVGSTGIFNCSTQLIAPDKILTNLHCLPREMKSVGIKCSKRMMIKFPKTNDYKAEESKCDSVIALSRPLNENLFGSNDWAVIKLRRKLKRNPVSATPGAISDKTELLAYPTYFSSFEKTIGDYRYSIPYGTIRKRSCETSMKNALSFFYFSKYSAELNFVCDSEIVPGNSGSGLYRNGGLVGLLNATLNHKSMSIVNDIFNTSFSLSEGRVVIGKNLYCVDYFNPSGPRANECYDIYNPLVAAPLSTFVLGKNLLVTSVDQGSNKIDQKNEELITENQDMFELDTPSDDFFKLVENSIVADASVEPWILNETMGDSLRRSFSLMPTCVKASVATDEVYYKQAAFEVSYDSPNVINVDSLGVIGWNSDRLGFIEYSLIFKKVYDEFGDTAYFEGSYEREGSDLYQNLFELETNFSELKSLCLKEKNQRFFVLNENTIESCRLKNEVKNAIELGNSTLTSANEILYNNERLLYDYSGLSDFKIKIPVCE